MSKRCCAKMCFNSQVTNRNVNYFGFPKYESYATQWAMAAHREDLLEKKLGSIIKYFLCSEHFSDDCFLDPPFNTKLRKTVHPLSIPIPTIFKCNINKYIPNANNDECDIVQIGYIQNLPEDESCLEERLIQVICPSTHPPDSITQNNNVDSVTDESIIHEMNETNLDEENNCNETDMNYLSDNSFDNIETYYIPDVYDYNSIIEEDVPEQEEHEEKTHYRVEEVLSESVCRLCATHYCEDEKLTRLFSDGDLVEKVNVLLPDTIHHNDGLSQHVCQPCIQRVEQCIDTLELFRRAQHEFHQSQDEI